MNSVSKFEEKITIRFRHCDPAGIVFYPRYVEIVNDLIEDWFASLGCGFEKLHLQDGVGVPVVSLNCTFKKPSRWNDKVAASLSVLSIGNSSVQLRVALADEDSTLRMSADVTLVCVDLQSMRPKPWSDFLRVTMSDFRSE